MASEPGNIPEALDPTEAGRRYIEANLREEIEKISYPGAAGRTIPDPRTVKSGHGFDPYSSSSSGSSSTSAKSAGVN